MCCCYYCNPEGAVLHSSTVLGKNEQHMKEIMDFDGGSEERIFVSFLLLLPGKLNGPQCLIFLSQTSTTWNGGTSSSTIALLILTVSPVFFLCGPRYTHVHTAEGMWPHVAQKISACGIWIANAPHVSLEKVWSAQEDLNSVCRRWCLKEET